MPLFLAASATSDQRRLHWWCHRAGPETLSSVIGSSIWLLHMVGQHHSDVLLAEPGGQSRVLVFLQVARVSALRPVTLLNLPSSTAALTSSSSLVFCPLKSLLQGFGTSIKPALPGPPCPPPGLCGAAGNPSSIQPSRPGAPLPLSSHDYSRRGLTILSCEIVLNWLIWCIQTPSEHFSIHSTVHCPGKPV